MEDRNCRPDRPAPAKRSWAWPRIVASILAGVFWPLVAWSGSGHDLFQQALVEERVRGDLDAAEQLYERIVREHPSDRRLVASALVRIGMLLEKRGRPQARARYELVAWDYADQRPSLLAARAGLARLGVSESTLAGRLPAAETTYTFAFEAENGVPISEFSFDPSGDRFVFVGPKRTDPERGRPQISISDASGTWVRPFVADLGEWRPKGARWSPDGRLIAIWTYPRDDPPVARVLLATPDGGAIRQVGLDLAGSIEDLVWTPDSRHLTILAPDGLHTRNLEGESEQFVPMPVRGHTTSLGGYSPGGRWLAYQTKSDYHARSDLWVRPAAGGSPVRLTDGSDLLARSGSSAWLHRPAWSTDGDALYFVSDRGGSPNLWRIGVDSEMRRRGEPAQITFFQDATVVHPRVLPDGRMAFALRRQNSVIQVSSTLESGLPSPVTRGLAPQLSPDGSTIYYLGEGPGQEGIYSVSRSGDTPPVKLTADTPDANFILRGFELSPDGEALAYQIREGDEVALIVVPTVSGSESSKRLHEFDLTAGAAPEPKWSPDGSRLAFGYQGRVYELSVETGELHELAELQEIDGWSVRWSPDGRQLAMLGWPEGGKVNEVFVVPASGGEARRLTGENGRYKEGLEWHPNGESLTFMSYGPDGVWQVRLDGSPPEPLIDQPDLWDYVGRWSPTGNHLYFVSARRGAETPWNLHVYDEAAGSVRRVWSSGEGSAGLPSFSHDGESLTWSVTRGSSQLWLMENFE